jgi:hypothetical protein
VVKAGQILRYADHQLRDGGRVVAQVTAQPQDGWDITGYAARAARDGRAVLHVHTGRSPSTASISPPWRACTRCGGRPRNPTLARALEA